MSTAKHLFACGRIATIAPIASEIVLLLSKGALVVRDVFP